MKSLCGLLFLYPIDSGRIKINFVFFLRDKMPRTYENKGIFLKWKSENMAAAIREVKENKMQLMTAAKLFDVPRNTLRARILTGRVSNRRGFGKEELINHLLLLDPKGFGMA